MGTCISHEPEVDFDSPGKPNLKVTAEPSSCYICLLLNSTKSNSTKNNTSLKLARDYIQLSCDYIPTVL